MTNYCSLQQYPRITWSYYLLSADETFPPEVKAIYLPWFQLSPEGSKALSSYIRHPWPHSSASPAFTFTIEVKLRFRDLLRQISLSPSSPLGRYLYPLLYHYPQFAFVSPIYICNLFYASAIPLSVPAFARTLCIIVAYPHLGLMRVFPPRLRYVKCFPDFWLWDLWDRNQL